MSRILDAAEAGERIRKERVPKGYGCCNRVAWAYDEESYDCHRKMGRYQKTIISIIDFFEADRWFALFFFN